MAERGVEKGDKALLMDMSTKGQLDRATQNENLYQTFIIKTVLY